MSGLTVEQATERIAQKARKAFGPATQVKDVRRSDPLSDKEQWTCELTDTNPPLAAGKVSIGLPK